MQKIDEIKILILQQFEAFLPLLTDKIDILQPLAYLNAVLRQATCESIQNHETSLKSKDKESVGFRKCKMPCKKSSRMVGVAQSRGTR